MAPQRAGRDITKQMLRHRHTMTDRMGIKRKAEEKKMNMNKNIARLAVTAGLTAALSFGGVMAPVTMAFAEGTTTTTNSITITQAENNASTKFKAYQIFRANVINEGNKKVVSNVDWAVGAEVQAKIIEAIKKSDGYGETSKKLPTTGVTAQNVADWLAENIQSAGAVDNDALLNKIASLVEVTDPVKPKDATDAAFDANFPVSFDESGYYLFLTDSGSISASTDDAKKANTGTSPIFAIVGGDPVTVKEKTSIPAVNKAVREDSDDRWTINGGDILTSPNKGADSSIGDYVEYRLVGTVASNINTYDSYEYTFKDKLPETMTPKYTAVEGSTTPAVTVKIDNTPVTNGFRADYQQEGHVLTVNFPNLKNCTDKNGNAIEVKADSRVTVEYEAMLDPQIICNNDGTLKDIYKDKLLGKAQKNTVKLEYSNNPHGEGIGTTVDHFAYDYTYGIDVTKVGSDDVTKGLEGVEFTLQEQGDDAGTFIMANGVKTDNEGKAKLKTDANGKINVVGLDEGTYILREVTPKPGYNNSAASGVTFTIKRDLNQDGTDVTPSTESVFNAAPGVVKDNQATATTGKLSFTIVDQKGSGLPLTGLNGVTFTWIAGGAVLCIGVAHLIRSRKQAEESEQE